MLFRSLDEPTNHLDMDMRESLAQALTDFEGALIVVAHDRHLLQAATDQWMLVADGRLAPFEGDLDDYKAWSREFQARGARRDTRDVPSVNRKEERRTEAANRKRESDAKRPFEKKLAAIESELKVLGEEAAVAESFLASSEAYEEAQRERMQETMRRRGEIATRMAQLEDDWLWMQAEMEKELSLQAARFLHELARGAEEVRAAERLQGRARVHHSVIVARGSDIPCAGSLGGKERRTAPGFVTLRGLRNELPRDSTRRPLLRAPR